MKKFNTKKAYVLYAETIKATLCFFNVYICVYVATVLQILPHAHTVVQTLKTKSAYIQFNLLANNNIYQLPNLKIYLRQHDYYPHRHSQGK